MVVEDLPPERFMGMVRRLCSIFQCQEPSVANICARRAQSVRCDTSGEAHAVLGTPSASTTALGLDCRQLIGVRAGSFSSPACFPSHHTRAAASRPLAVS
jgi:hypothetical protein